MASSLGKPRARPAHTQGATHCAYTPDGTRLITVGSNNTIRVYKTGFDGEPTNIDECPEQNVAIAATNDFFVVGSEDGTVSLYSLATCTFDQYLLRTSLPIRDLALSHDGKWCAVASDELSVKVVSTQDMTHVRVLKEHGKPTKHLSFDPKSSVLSLSCTDGIIYIYSLTADQPELIKKVDGVIGMIDNEAESSAHVAWHPDGRAFAVPTPTREIQVVSKNDWEKQRAFKNGHDGDITALAWSPNGALLATAGKDRKLLIWETKNQSVVARHDYAGVVDIVWHPTNNLVAFANSDGYIYICPDFISEQYALFLRLPQQPAPFIHDPLSETSANAPRPQPPGQHKALPIRDGSPDSMMHSLMGDEYGDEDDDFVVDDDGAGYAVNGNGKRPHADTGYGNAAKRMNLLNPTYHEAFQPGSTPWRGNRKYLCLNLVGFVWTVDQDSHHTVTVEFYDHGLHRDFHFTDTFLYDKACLNDNGALFSCPPRDDAPATIFYRPHETWTHRSDWRTQLPEGEAVLAMSLSDSFITVMTSANYVRVFTLFGIPHRVYRQKSAPVVTCASWRDYVLTIGNGPMAADGSTRLLYTIENVKRDEICQNEDTVALPEGVQLKSVFFSDRGDPCIYDTSGTLLTLLHWRSPSRASWVPLLDTKLLSRLASGRKRETYFPIAVADDKFHCIILKGGDQHPYFPRPLLSEFDFSIPLAGKPPKQGKKSASGRGANGGGDDGNGNSNDNADEDEDDEDEVLSEMRQLEQALLLEGIQAAQTQDLVESTSGAREQQLALRRLELEVDKTLLQMLAAECREGEERGMRALEMVGLMRDRSGRMVEAAGKVAERYGRTVLGEKIRELGERMLAGGDGEEGGMDEDF